MKRIMVALVLFVASAAWAGNTEQTVRYYSDGALVSIEATATQGTADIPLAADMGAGSLRIKPLGTASIVRVELLPPSAAKGDKHLDRLMEQRNRLEDRLRALKTREDIFRSAAKSQSGKAPRKTKTNPDPMQSIRQGTDFAIAQLESVYTLRRKTEQEIRRLDADIAAAGKLQTAPAGVARVTMTPRSGRLQATYLIPGRGWSPSYDFRLKSGAATGSLSLMGLLPPDRTPGRVEAVFGTVVAGGPGVTVKSTGPMLLGSWEVPVSQMTANPLRFSYTSTAAAPLPSGPAAVFVDQEYVGHTTFRSISSGRSGHISLSH